MKCKARALQGRSGYPILSSAVDLIEIGAGGGSVAKVNDLGLITVGPESMGSAPGPACYGRGGETVADANLILGYLDPDEFLGGQFKLDLDLAEKAINKHIAKKLGISVLEAATGIFEVVVEQMGRAQDCKSLRKDMTRGTSQWLHLVGLDRFMRAVLRK